MMEIAELLFPQPSPLWRLIRQCGVDHAVGVLAYEPDAAVFSWSQNHGTTLAQTLLPDLQPWSLPSLRSLQARYAEAGFTLAVIESSPPMARTRLGLPGRDEEIAAVCIMLRAMGELGIPVWCYNWMAEANWGRTDVAAPTRGGALTTSFDLAQVPQTDNVTVPEEQLWASLSYFLDRVLPVAEEAGVRLAMHPDDPPLSPYRGIGRIMSSVENFQRLLDLAPSASNGITLCQGNFVLMTDRLPELIEQFGAQGKIFFVHMRDTRGTPERFEETFHDDGPTDMLACMRAYRATGYQGVMRPDHVPTMEGETNANPGYETLGRLFAIGYLRGLHEAVYGKRGGA